MHNLEKKKEKKKVFPKLKAAAQAAPAKKEVKDMTRFLPTFSRLAVQPGGTDQKETSLIEGSYSHSHEAKGTRLQVFPCSAGNTLPKA